ncbi:MAG: hypothetical protein WCE94_00655 [Candidatus Methanoperedens sp.]
MVSFQITQHLIDLSTVNDSIELRKTIASALMKRLKAARIVTIYKGLEYLEIYKDKPEIASIIVDLFNLVETEMQKVEQINTDFIDELDDLLKLNRLDKGLGDTDKDGYIGRIQGS